MARTPPPKDSGTVTAKSGAYVILPPVLDIATGQRYEFPYIPMEIYLSLNQIIYRFGKEGIKGDEGAQMAYRVMVLGAATVKDLEDADYKRIEGLVSAAYQWKQEENWDSDIDPLISCCYHLLVQRRITPKESAEIARKELEEPVTKGWEDTWRIRVSRWASDNGKHIKRNLPPVSLPRGGSRKRQTNK